MFPWLNSWALDLLETPLFSVSGSQSRGPVQKMGTQKGTGKLLGAGGGEKQKNEQFCEFA